MARLDFRGGAAKCTASGAVTNSAVSVALSGDTSGWPTGASSRNFVVIIDRGVSGKMEKVLCSALSGGTLTIATRGYDGTVAVAHDAGATFEHGLNAGVLDDLSAHVYDDTRDDHSQYLPVDTTVRGLSDASGIADVPVDVGTAIAEGTADTLARSDHVHRLGANSVTTPKIAANAVTFAKLDTAITPIQICTSATRPGTPTAGMTIFETDTLRYYGYSGSAWVFIDSLATGEDKVSIQSAVVTGGPTSGTATSTLATMVIAAKPFAYTITVAAFWSALDSVVGDTLHFAVRVDGTSKGGITARFSGGGDERRPMAVPTTTPVVVAANTACTVTVVAGRTGGTGTFTEEEVGVVTATMVRLNP